MTKKEQAIKLRKKGYSYNYIAEKTGYAVSTLSYHLRHIPFTPNKFTRTKIGSARAQAAMTKNKQKQDSYHKAKKQAVNDIGTMSERDFFMLGLGLYIGEGSKTHDTTRLVNADSEIIKLFLKWVTLLGIPRENISMRIHLYPESDIQSAVDFWSKETRIPKGQFQKACIDTRVGKDRKRQSRHEYGTAHVTVRANGQKEFGVALARKIGAYMEEVLR